MYLLVYLPTVRKLLYSALFCSTIFLASCGINHETSILKFHRFSLNFQNSQGRINQHVDGSIELIGPASFVEIVASGDSVSIPVINPLDHNNYVTVFIEDTVVDRYVISASDTTYLGFNLSKKSNIKLVKDTEASNGPILIPGIWADSVFQRKEQDNLLIEFIGNSITCGMGADTTDILCGENQWFDQHRASLAYGPLAARDLGAEYLLSSVSGIGIYRTWNDENIIEPTMPQVYDNLYLNRDTTFQYQPSKSPDLISICLGTNDLSDGDGIKERLPFDQSKFVEGYVKFISHLIDLHPQSKIVLLTSPMVGGEKGVVLKESLKQVVESFKSSKQIKVFEFEQMIPTGCTYHPSLSEHQIMAKQLIPFYQEILNPNL